MSIVRPSLLTPVSVRKQPSSNTAKLKFSGLLPYTSPVLPRRILEHLDFTAVGASPVKQIAIIFSSLITWRLLAANERRKASVSKRWNELRENLMRDLLGFAFWFLGVPVLQRFYLGAVAQKNPKLKDILIRNVADESKKPKGILSWLKGNNPLNNWYIPSSQQVKDQMHQALASLEKAGMGANHNAYIQTQTAYLHLIKHRNFATALGLGSTILLLGVGINLLNFYLTRKNVTSNLPASNVSLALPVSGSGQGLRQSQGQGQPLFVNPSNSFHRNIQPGVASTALQQSNPFQWYGVNQPLP